LRFILISFGLIPRSLLRYTNKIDHQIPRSLLRGSSLIDFIQFSGFDGHFETTVQTYCLNLPEILKTGFSLNEELFQISLFFLKLLL